MLSSSGLPKCQDRTILSHLFDVPMAQAQEEIRVSRVWTGSALVEWSSKELISTEQKAYSREVFSHKFGACELYQASTNESGVVRIWSRIWCPESTCAVVTTRVSSDRKGKCKGYDPVT